MRLPPPRLPLALAFVCALLVSWTAHGAPKAFVQKSDAAISSGSSVSTSFKKANVEGNLIVAFVVWDGSGSASVSDSQGNAYQGVADAASAEGFRAQLFYARDVTSGKNSVTATFGSGVATRGELYVHEYTGLSRGAPLDVSSVRSGTGAAVDSGEIDTHSSGELLFLAIASDARSVKLDRGWKSRAKRGGVVTAEIFSGDAGSYDAIAQQSGTSWTAQLVGFNYSGVPPKGSAAYPIKVAPNSIRYLVDQDGKPFLMTGDSPQAMFANISESDAAKFLSDRQKRGFNVMWVNLLCNDGTHCNANGTTFDGIPELNNGFDLTSPNEAYFARVDRMIRMAASKGITILLDPAETRGYLQVLLDQPQNARKWGQWVGKRYRGFDNILWMSGNDFHETNLPTPSENAVVQDVARGIRDEDENHIHTVELNFYTSGSLDDPSWEPLIDFNASYTYNPTYAQVLKDYNHNAMPTFMVEAHYEFENDAQGDQTNAVLRRQVYWSLLSGATGHLYGNGFTHQFKDGWQSHLKTQASGQMTIAKKLFEERSWWELVPDQNHQLVTDGVGDFDSSRVPIMSNDYVTAARTPDGDLALVYVPGGNTITVDLSRMAGPVDARWFDPARGSFAKVPGSPLDNTGPMQLTPPGKNRDGDTDWVLVLEAD